MKKLRSIALGKKFLIVILITMMPTAILLLKFYQNEYKTIVSTKAQIYSIEHIVLLRELLQTVAEHRGIGNAYLKGASDLKSRLVEKENKIESDMSALENLTTNGWAEFNYSAEWKIIRDDWKSLKSEYTELEPAVSFNRHTHLISEVKTYMDLISAGSGLMLNSDLESASLVNVLTNGLPLFAETMGQARGVASGVAAQGSAPQEAKTALIAKLSRIYDLAHSLEGFFALAFEAKPDLKEVVGPRVDQLIKVSNQYAEKIDSSIVKKEQITVSASEIFDAGTIVIKISVNLWKDTVPELIHILENRIAVLWRDLIVAIVTTAVTVIIALLFASFILRDVIKRISRGVVVLEEIEKGNFTNEISATGNDEPAQLLRALGNMQEGLAERIDRDAASAAETLRVKLALEHCATARIMVLDASQAIVYMNPALVNLLNSRATQIQREFSEFSVNTLIGQAVDIFDNRQTGASISQQIRDLKTTKRWELSAGELTFGLTAAAVTNEAGEHTSTVIEWKDRTMELAIEEEVQNVVDAAKEGDMKQRIDLKDKSDFFIKLGTSVNQLMDSSEHVINETVRVLGAVSKGDLKSKIDGDYKGVFQRLKSHVNETVDKLTEVSAEMKRNAYSVADGSQSIFEDNEELARRTIQQQHNLDQTTTSMDQITTAVKQTADNAQNADKLAVSAGSHAEKGTVVMNEVESAMEEINRSSKKISAITGVIDDIAFQTNLLALNASVEAARAGEQGRGFAVVASEVRNLAGRSAEAAKEIKELIEESVKKIEDGSTMVDKSGKSLNEIVVSVNQVTDIVAEIATASREQSRGIEQVNLALNEMDNTTKENAELVKQNAEASKNMGEDAKELKEKVAFFQTDETSAIRRAA